MGQLLSFSHTGGWGGEGTGWHGPLAGTAPALGTGWGWNEHKFWQEVVLPCSGPTGRYLAGEQGQAGTPRPPASPRHGAASGTLPRLPMPTCLGAGAMTT